MQYRTEIRKEDLEHFDKTQTLNFPGSNILSYCNISAIIITTDNENNCYNYNKTIRFPELARICRCELTEFHLSFR